MKPACSIQFFFIKYQGSNQHRSSLNRGSQKTVMPDNMTLMSFTRSPFKWNGFRFQKFNSFYIPTKQIPSPKIQLHLSWGIRFTGCYCCQCSLLSHKLLSGLLFRRELKITLCSAQFRHMLSFPL